MRATRTKLGCLRINSTEWHRAWSLLADTTGDLDRCAEHPETQESWQYLGSSLRPGESGWAHEFRHRTHPSTNRQWLVFVPASPGWRPGDLSEPLTSQSA